jgi:hypothetical protein
VTDAGLAERPWLPLERPGVEDQVDICHSRVPSNKKDVANIFLRGAWPAERIDCSAKTIELPATPWSAGLPPAGTESALLIAIGDCILSERAFPNIVSSISKGADPDP